MATETITRLVDDLDGATAERTVVYGWDGHTYEIDLSKKKITALEKALKPYLALGHVERLETQVVGVAGDRLQVRHARISRIGRGLPAAG